MFQPATHNFKWVKITYICLFQHKYSQILIFREAFQGRIQDLKKEEAQWLRGPAPKTFFGLKETKMFLPHPRVKVSIVGSLRDREVACSASDRQGSNFESCVWRTVSSQSSHHPQEVLLAQFSLYVHRGGLKPDSFHFISQDVFGQFRGLFKKIGAKRGGRAPSAPLPPLDPRLHFTPNNSDLINQ